PWKGAILHRRAVTWAHGCSAGRGALVGSASEAVLMQRTASLLLPTLIAALFLTGCPEKKVEKEEPAAPTAVDKSGAAEKKEKAAEDEHGEEQDDHAEDPKDDKKPAAKKKKAAEEKDQGGW